MPELPEVEVTRRTVQAALAGARIRSVWLGKPLRWPLGCEPESLVGRTIEAVQRRGKYVLIQLDEGWLLVHLGMSGSLRVGEGLRLRGPHDHAEVQTDRGLLRLTDPRRFGALIWASALDQGLAAKLLGGLGVEPLTDAFTAAGLHAGLRGRAAAIKSVLLAGDLVVGVGNIYACEALHLARIHPATSAARIGVQRAQRLHAAIVAVLTQALGAGGSTVRNFLGADGQQGHFQTLTQVYGRAGAPCARCGGTVRRIVQGQRATYFCPGCQRR